MYSKYFSNFEKNSLKVNTKSNHALLHDNILSWDWMNEWTKWLLTFLDGTIFLNSANVNSSLSLARFSLKTFSKCLRFSGVSSVRFLQVQIDKYYIIQCIKYISRSTDTRWLNPKFFAAQIQIPIPNKYLGFCYKGLVFL